MPWYVIWKNKLGTVMGFIEDENELPKSWETEEKALEDMEDHILKNSCDYIEL